LFAAGTMKKIDVAAQAHRLRKVDFRRGSKLGYLDQVVEYRKPHRPNRMSKKEYMKYPDRFAFAISGTRYIRRAFELVK
jgi:hypothetical protein